MTTTYLHPSIEEYEHLSKLHGDDLDCPCSQISIPYDAFITELEVNAFHEICSSRIIADNIQGLPYFIYLHVSRNDIDFESWRDGFIVGIEQLCQTAQESVANSIDMFLTSTMLAYQAVPRTEFTNEINVTLHHLKTTIPLSFARTLDLIRTTIQGNALMGMFPPNWKLLMTDKSKGKNALFLSVPVSYTIDDKNTTCSCSTTPSCSIPAQLFKRSTPYYSFKGLMLSCSLLETILQSSLSCFYSLTCINEVRHAVGISPFFRSSGWTDMFGIPVAMNAISTRFAINDTIETIAYNMFIETWLSNVSYEMFFNACGVKQCTYIDHYRFDVLEFLTTFFSIYAGLSLGLRFFVPHFVRMIEKIRNRFCIMPS